MTEFSNSGIFIYKITNPLGQAYIGKSGKLLNRVQAYRANRCKWQRLLYASIQKHGFDSHEISILHELPIDCESKVVGDYERLYIQFHKDAGFDLLNLTNGGCSNYSHSEETKRLIGDKNRGKASKYKGAKRDPSIGNKISKSRKKKKYVDWTPEMRKAFGEMMSKYAKDPKRIEAIRKANVGQKRPKTSDALRKYHASKK